VVGNAREMDSTVMNNHIKLYVNEYTLNLGIRGREAVVELFRIAGEKGVVPVLPDRIFLTSF
jgi:1,4-dihydroxy-6-naphthoate synthase